MITGSLKNQVDRVWDTFWSGGISNPMDVIEQFTYLLFIRQLDERQNEIEQKKLLGVPVHDEEIIFTTKQEDLRWKNLMQIGDPTELHETMATRVFPFLKTMGTGTLAALFRDASFGISSPSTLRKTMELINDLDIKNRDITGDLYEYMLSKLATSGTNGQFRTPQHIIDLLVELMAPKLGERIIDPACGTAGFLINASEWMKRTYREDLYNTNERERFYRDTFTGYDFDRSMVRIAAMNSYMHGFEKPNISYRDSLGELPLEEQAVYDVILANPPFSGSLDAERVDPVIRKLANTKKTELLFLARFLTLLKVGGRAAVIVPEGVLFGSTKAHKVPSSTSPQADSNPIPVCQPRFCVSRRPTPVVPTRYGSMTCLPTAEASTINAPRCFPKTYWAQHPTSLLLLKTSLRIPPLSNSLMSS